MSDNKAPPAPSIGNALSKAAYIAFAIALCLALLSHIPGPMGSLFKEALAESRAPFWALLGLIACTSVLAFAWMWRLAFPPGPKFFAVVRQSADVLLGASYVLCGVLMAVCLATWSLRPWGPAALATGLMYNLTFAYDSVLSPTRPSRTKCLFGMASNLLLSVLLVFVALRIADGGWEAIWK